MLEFIVKQKYCGCIKKIVGFDIWDALKKNNLDCKVWVAV